MYGKTKHIHFVGIGGIGMSGIAELLANLGYRVSGSDLRRSKITDRLSALGCKFFEGHDRKWIEGAEVIVASSAIAEDNPEILAARDKGVPVVMRAEMLAELMRLQKYGIAIAGSHGKTSTTSMVSWIMAQAGLDPTMVVGGKVDCMGGNAKLGEGEFLVAEADESDGSFLKLSPVLEVVTNIDFEHPDFYADIEEVKEAFIEFIDKVPFYGAAIICLDDQHIAEVLPRISKRLITYGLTRQSEVYAENLEFKDGRSRFDTYRSGELLGTVELNQPGLHNVYNSLAAICVGLELEIDFSVIAKAPSRTQRGGGWHHGGGRLWPSSDGNTGDPECDQAGLARQAPGCAFPAAPLQPHQRVVQRISNLFSPGRLPGDDRYLRGQRRADRRYRQPAAARQDKAAWTAQHRPRPRGRHPGGGGQG
jgi:UDP-N-acetylmuramate--alanine ligase